MKLTIPLLLLFVLPLAYAGTPDDLITTADRSEKEWETSVRALLDSSDPRLQAWGAWHVANRRMASLQSEVYEKLQAGLSQKDKLDHRWVLAITDALIQTRATVSEKHLLRLFELTYPDQTVVLASFTPELQKNLLLKLASDTGSNVFATTCNLLAKHHALAFSDWALGFVKPELYVSVLDPEPGDVLDRNSFGQRSGMGRRNIENKPAEVWPPLVQHDILLEPSDNGDLLLANGAKPVYFRRIVPSQEARAEERPKIKTYVDKRGYSLLALKNLAGLEPDDEPRLVGFGTTLTFVTAEKYLSELNEKRASAQEPWDELVDMLKNKVGPIETKVRVKIIIKDLREKNKTPLPAFDEKNIPPLKLENVDVP